MKNIYILVTIFVFVMFFSFYNKNSPKEIIGTNEALKTDHKNTTYIIDGNSITLKDGFSETNNS